MACLSFDLHAAGVLAPGIGSVDELLGLCRRDTPLVQTPPLPPLPAPDALPAQERRRTSQVVRLVMACADQAVRGGHWPRESLRTVLATDEGTGEVCQHMLESLATTGQVSPMVFTNSVLNAPAGYLSIAWRSRQPATVVSMGTQSFVAGLVAAVTESICARQPVLLVSYDPALTSPMTELWPILEPTASAWVVAAPGLAPAGSSPLAAWSLERAADPGLGATPLPEGLPGCLPDGLADDLPAWLPARWAAHGSARGLAALGLLRCEPGATLRLALAGTLWTLTLKASSCHAT